MSHPQSNPFKPALVAKVDDLLLDGTDVFIFSRQPEDSLAILTNLRTKEEVKLAPERVLAMKLLVPGAIIQTGGAPHHIVDVTPAHEITYTQGGDSEEQTMHALFYAESLAALRQRNYGPLGEQSSDADDDLIITDEDLAEDAAYTDEDLERLTGAPLPPVEDEDLPPGEAQSIPPALMSEDGEVWRVGDSFRRRDGREYTIAAIDGEDVHLNHRVNGVLLDSCVPMRDLPKLTADAGLIGTDVRDEMIDALKQRVRQLESDLYDVNTINDELSRQIAEYHDEDRDTEPLALETVKQAVRASQEMAQVEIIEIGDYVVESIFLSPVNLFDPKAAAERNREITRLRNADEKWYVVFEAAEYAISDGHQSSMHVARLERHLRKDDGDPGQGEPERRDILDQANDIIDAYEPDDVPVDADAETETDLAPVPQAFRTTEYPITATLRMVGADAVKDFYNTQVCEVFNLARGRSSVPAIPGEVTS